MLVSFATRLIVCRCLVNKTFAGARVLNAPVDPLADVVRDAPTIPTIAVFSGQLEAKAQGRDMTAGARTLSLTLQIFAPPAAEVEGGDLKFEARGAGAAALIDFTWRQCAAALVRENGTWPKLFAEFAVGFESVTATPVLYEVARGGEIGPRVPAVEYDLACRVMAEPGFGIPLKHHWLRLDAAMRAEPELTPLADLIKGMIEQPDGMPGWRAVQAALGLSDAAIRASGLSPQDATETGEAAELAEDGLTVDPADLHDSQPFDIGKTL